MQLRHCRVSAEASETHQPASGQRCVQGPFIPELHCWEETRSETYITHSGTAFHHPLNVWQ